MNNATCVRCGGRTDCPCEPSTDAREPLRCLLCAAVLQCSICTEEPTWADRQTQLHQLAEIWRSTAELGDDLPFSKNDPKAQGYREALITCSSMLGEVIDQQRMNGQQLTNDQIKASVQTHLALIRKARAMHASPNDARAFLDELIEALRDEQRAPDKQEEEQTE